MSSLQKKYNEFRDEGGNHTTFLRKNKLNLEEKQELFMNYERLKEKREQDPKERLKIIRKRIKNYREHENDPYAYYQAEINEVSVLLKHAPADIEFLLKENDQLHARIKNLWFELRAANKQLRKNRR